MAAAATTIILSAGISGILDISATGIVTTRQGIPFQRLLQFVASGALGSSAFEGGKKTAGAGLLLHFLIAGAVASIYYLVSRLIPISADRPVLFGALYGITVHLFMSRIVVPLSRAPKREFTTKAFLTQLIIHVFCVGLPISITQHYLS